MSHDLSDIEALTGLTLAQAISLVKGIMRAVHNMVELLPDNPADRTIVFAILLGQLEGKPLGLTKVSHFTRLSRSTVARRIAAMEKDGVLVRTEVRGRGYAVVAKDFAVKVLLILTNLGQ